MPDGPLFPGQEAQGAFPNSPPGATTPCIPAPGGGAPAGPGWTVNDVKKNLDACDGGTGVVAGAKKANGGKDPTIVQGASVIGTGGSVDTTTGTITLDPVGDKCSATQTLVQESANLSRKDQFAKAASSCGSGDLSRDEFIRANEKAEYDGVKEVLTAFDACKDKWGCAKGATSIHEWARSSKDFDDYYNNKLGNHHKEHYGKWWDSNCKAAYDAKHPPPPPPPPAKTGCFIATAAYGSAIAPEVQFLRQLRDGVLRKTGWGSRFFEQYWSHYYRFSPAISEEMDRDPEFREVVRWSVVSPMVNYLRLLVERPAEWNLEGVDPELRRFLDLMRRDMEEWLSHIPVPVSFEGMDAGAILSELRIALELVLKSRAKREEYLDALSRNGVIPLDLEPGRRAAAIPVLLEAGWTPGEIGRVLTSPAEATESS